MNTIYQLPTWAETVLVVCVALMLAGLAAFIGMKAITEAIEAESRLHRKRQKSETTALDNWRAAYEAEHAEHLQDVANLTNELIILRREIKIKNAILEKVKVKDL